MTNGFSPTLILGTMMDVVGILAGVGAMMIWRRTMSESAQRTVRTGIAMVTVVAGLHLYWTHMGGGFLSVLKQSFIVMVALSLGSLTGFLLKLQSGSNRLGRYATELLDQAVKTGRRSFQDGFITTTILFCVTPLCLIGAIQEGLIGDWRSLAIKSCVDALSVMAFVGVFGRGVVCVALPVLAWQGSLTIAIRLSEPWLSHHGLVDPIITMSGMLLCAVSLQILQIGKVRVTDYLPGLFMAPLLTWLWRVIFG